MLVFWFFVNHRGSLNKTLQFGALWGLIFLGAIAAYGVWDDIRHTITPQQSSFAEEGKIVVPQNPDGHFYLRATVNTEPVLFVLDTGATDMVLTRLDAERVGLDPDTLIYTGRANTANGEVKTATVRLDTMQLGPVTDRDVPAVVNGGTMEQSLLGMRYLQRWGKLEISDGELTLTR